MKNEVQKNVDYLWQEFQKIINKQLEVNIELKGIVEDITKTSYQEKASDLTEERVNKIQDLFIEMESLFAEERAVYHSLFGIDE